MSGGSELVAQSSNYRFLVRYSSSAGIRYLAFEVERLKPETNQWGWREAEWCIPVAEYLDEKEEYLLYDAFKELDKEKGTLRAYDQLTKEQRTLSDIWSKLQETESWARTWKQRAEKAEHILNELQEWWYEEESRKKKETESSSRELSPASPKE
jgi:hypothetical protein